MKFGTSIDPAGGVHFRLWAPQAKAVQLCLLDGATGKHLVEMAGAADGWYAVHQPEAKAGDLYQFLINDELLVPDPASRFQADDIHGPSVVWDPARYKWHDDKWRGRPWEEAVVYELHVGCFSSGGTFREAIKRLDFLADLGVTAIEIMPVAQFPGKYNWGYDGALLFAPCSAYGNPDEFKELIDAAHQRRLMVFLDVVYNHFGPEGNYLYVYARDAFFTEQFTTPWGAAINYCGEQSKTVREFYLANVLYWLEEFHLDGLRFDAVHSIFDPCRPDILEEIAERVNSEPGRQHPVYLVLENDNNCADYLVRKDDGQPRLYTAQWNDDFHHACHILATGETEGYYKDYSDRPIRYLGRCLTEGFGYQGELSPFRDNVRRGQVSGHLPPQAFVSFLQNHDQIGNRALGERLAALADPQDVKLLTALFLLSPSPPLLFMGEEFGSEQPFCFFCDFSVELAEKVVAGRLAEFAHFAQFRSPEALQRIPDPTSRATFERSKLDWPDEAALKDNSTLGQYRQLLRLRLQEIVPRLKKRRAQEAGYQVLADKALWAWWTMNQQETLMVFVNLHDHEVMASQQAGRFLVSSLLQAEILYQDGWREKSPAGSGALAPRSILWLVDESGEPHE